MVPFGMTKRAYKVALAIGLVLLPVQLVIALAVNPVALASLFLDLLVCIWLWQRARGKDTGVWM
ncbi:MAG: hypothetical protein NTW87_08050 [Planctomycetota bacterium]|nr:hypothetical protein [Planctomycetota bacterium]